jgi:hypothetical protein
MTAAGAVSSKFYNFLHIGLNFAVFTHQTDRLATAAFQLEILFEILLVLMFPANQRLPSL